MKDGAHAHHNHSGGSGLWLGVVIALVLVAGSGAIAAALAELVRLLLIGLAVTAALAITACVVLATRHRQPPGLIASRPAVVVRPDHSGREIAALRAELAALRRQVASVTAPDDLHDLDGWQPPALPVWRPGREG